MFRRMEVNTIFSHLARSAGLPLALAAAAVFVESGSCSRQTEPSLRGLVPEIATWALAEDIQVYLPESLFEYINGAAESYLSYDFRELLVAQFERPEAEATVTLEIYDMGNSLNAFGIFSAERYPENRTIPVGDAAYIESEALNFLAGRYYVKLLGFGAGEETESVLKTFGEAVSSRARPAGGIPELFRAMPVRGLVPRSEKFIRKNFLGYEFLRNGYVASYKVDDREIECFVIETGSEEEAETMESRFLDSLAEDRQVPEKIALGYRVKNRYAQNLFLGRMGRHLYGVVRVPDGLEGDGERYLKDLKDSLSRRGSGR
jgi:hypothetical protein